MPPPILMICPDCSRLCTLRTATQTGEQFWNCGTYTCFGPTRDNPAIKYIREEPDARTNLDEKHQSPHI